MQSSDLLSYLDLLSNSTAALSVVIMWFLWKVYQKSLQKNRDDHKSSLETKANVIEAMSVNTSAMNAI